MIAGTGTLFPELVRESETGFTTGILPSQTLRELVACGYIGSATPVLPEQIQPSSIDLRLGSAAYRVRASFLPGEASTVARKLADHKLHELDLTRPAVLEKGCVYIIPLQEELSLPAQISGKVNPKSSTGRLDIFTRLITDYGRQFEFIPAGYRGKLYAEVVPRTFSVVVREGARLSQLRLTRGAPQFSDADLARLDRREMLVYGDGETPAEANIASGLRLSVDLNGFAGSEIIGYRAKKHSSLIDLERIDYYEPTDFWDPIHRTKNRDLVLDPEDFYILASKEKVRIPPGFAAEMVPYDPSVGEFRIHYAGFFDPGFGYGTEDIKGTRAVLEVRSHEVPFLLEDGQEVGSLTFERLMSPPDRLYGQGIGSSYQKQGIGAEQTLQVSAIDRAGDYFRYSILASDPGLQQVKQGAKTVIAVVITLLVFHALRPEISLFAGICAGFMMQCTAGTERREKQRLMLLMGAGVIVSTGLGNTLAAHDWIKDALLAAVAFTVYYVRRFLPGKAMFPLFGFTLTLLATLRPGAARLYMVATAGSAAAAFAVYFYMLPDETPLAFRHAFNLFLFHARRLRENPRSRKDLRVLHAAVAFSQGEAKQLCHLAPDLCDGVLTEQYEALQVLTILTDTALEEGSDESRRAAVAFCELEYDRLAPELSAAREMLEAR